MEETIMNTMEETRKFLESIGQPGGDLYQLPDSDKRFDDGCQYRFEVPGIQSPGVMKALLEEIDRIMEQGENMDVERVEYLLSVLQMQIKFPRNYPYSWWYLHPYEELLLSETFFEFDLLSAVFQP